jgi:hypothetical protein
MDKLMGLTPLTGGERREVARLRRTIRDEGWALARGCVEVDGAHFDARYTAGLTRHHGHPELIVVGARLPREQLILHGLAEQVAAGATLEPCWVSFGSRQLALVPVDEPEVLWLAHLVYAAQGHPVSALQVVAPDDRGRWPWSGGDAVVLGDWPFAAEVLRRGRPRRRLH